MAIGPQVQICGAGVDRQADLCFRPAHLLALDCNFGAQVLSLGLCGLGGTRQIVWSRRTHPEWARQNQGGKMSELQSGHQEKVADRHHFPLERRTLEEV